jgi:hypothetical protein
MLLAFIVKGTVPRDLKKSFLHFVAPDSLAASFSQISQNSLSDSSGCMTPLMHLRKCPVN